jgi:hypothetical protein
MQKTSCTAGVGSIIYDMQSDFLKKLLTFAKINANLFVESRN